MKTAILTILALFLTCSVHAAEKPSQGFLKKAIEGNYSALDVVYHHHGQIRAVCHARRQ